MDKKKTEKRIFKKYSDSLKLKACYGVLQEGLTLKESARKYEIGSSSSIRNWIYELGLHPDYKPLKAKPHFSEALKKEICFQVAYKQMSKEHAMRYYGLRSATNITYWMKKYNIAILEDTYEEPIVSMKSKKVTSASENIHQENKLLKKELEEALLSSEVNAKIIELASKELGIDIRKKFNTKQ
tara:strand:- start:939 stop:1490 length:552 start_codon:yes stop_codon:yes gene_type:complete